MNIYDNIKQEINIYLQKYGFVNVQGGWKLENNEVNRNLMKQFVKWNFKLENLKNKAISQEYNHTLNYFLKIDKDNNLTIDVILLWDFLNDLDY